MRLVLRKLFSITQQSVSRMPAFIFNRCQIKHILSLIIFAVLPVQSVYATSGIANSVRAFCLPSPTVPDVASCSACHSTTTNRGPNDLTTAGQWSLSRANYSNFCPSAAPAPTPPPTPAPTPTPPATPAPTPGTGVGMSRSRRSSSMGRGSGSRFSSRGDDDDDDDDDRRRDDDDD